MHACAFGIQHSCVQLGGLSGCCSIHDDPSKIAQAANAFGGVFAAQHFKHRIHTFAVGQVFDGFFVIALLVVDSVLQPQRFYAR